MHITNQVYLIYRHHFCSGPQVSITFSVVLWSSYITLFSSKMINHRVVLLCNFIVLFSAPFIRNSISRSLAASCNGQHYFQTIPVTFHCFHKCRQLNFSKFFIIDVCKMHKQALQKRTMFITKLK